jgi:hypothetical protein
MACTLPGIDCGEELGAVETAGTDGGDPCGGAAARAPGARVSQDLRQLLCSAGHSTAPRSGNAANTCGHCSKWALQDAVHVDLLTSGPRANGREPQPPSNKTTAMAKFFTIDSPTLRLTGRLIHR